MIDPRIAMGVKLPEIESPMNALAGVLQVQGAQQKNMLGQMQIDETQRGQAGENMLAQLLAGGKNPDEVATGLASGGFGKQSLDYTKGQAELGKSRAAAEKDQIAATMQKLQLGAQILGSARDQSSYDAARQSAQQAGLDVSRMPPQYDPAFVQSKLQEGQTIAQQLDQKWKAMEYTTPTASAVLTSQTAAAGRAITQRGQDLTDSRARDFNAAKTEENRIKLEQGKPLNEGQGKALLFGSRMRESDKIIEQLTAEGSGTSVPGSRAPIIGGIINSLSSGNQQMLDQAKRDFMSAVLRRESGAAISNGEYDNADKQYFPQIGDSQGVITQKSKNRKLALEGILLEVPQQHRGTLQPTERAPAAPAGTMMAVKDAADYAKVPSGATYTTPDGKVRRKP